MVPVYSGCEKRREPRISKDFMLHIGDSNISAEALDISPTGLSCLMDKKIPELSEMKIEVCFSEENSKAPICCSGIVVRCIPDRRSSKQGKDSKFVTALYFMDLQSQDKKKISRIIKQ